MTRQPHTLCDRCRDDAAAHHICGGCWRGVSQPTEAERHLERLLRAIDVQFSAQDDAAGHDLLHRASAAQKYLHDRNPEP